MSNLGSPCYEKGSRSMMPRSSSSSSPSRRPSARVPSSTRQDSKVCVLAGFPPMARLASTGDESPGNSRATGFWELSSLHYVRLRCRKWQHNLRDGASGTWVHLWTLFSKLFTAYLLAHGLLELLSRHVALVVAQLAHDLAVHDHALYTHECARAHTHSRQ
jgi:hypothetical protein